MNIGYFFQRLPYENNYLHVMERYHSYPFELKQVAESFGHRFVLVCLDESYIGDGWFTNYWDPINEPIGVFNKVDEKIKIDILFDKGHFTNNDGLLPTVNHSELMKFANNKYSQSVVFEDYMPRTELATNANELKSIINKFNSKVIIKPLHLTGGAGIKVAKNSKDDLHDIEYPAVVQEFIDGSSGIEGITKGLHDLRVYLLGDEPSLVSIRKPAEGSELSNTHLGGSIEYIDSDKIPKELEMLIGDINIYFKKYGKRFISLDFIYANDRWYLIEANERPGVPAEFQGKFASEFQRKLIKYLVS